MTVPAVHPSQQLTMTAAPFPIRYAEAEYWEARYQREPLLFEWFLGHTALRRIIRACISKTKPVLHIGCGTSNLQEGMAQSGYQITNTDVSEVVIKQMQQRHAQYTNMSYRISDCRCMPEFLDCSFGHVIDKGTMDALLCCKQGTENVMNMLLEVYRVLQPGGSFLLITLGDPSRRLPMLCVPQLQWKISLLLLPKLSAANQLYVDGKPCNDSVEPVKALGPFEVVDQHTILDLPEGVQYSSFLFAFVCKKQPLQLPLCQGQKKQLPSSWVAESRELFQKLQKELDLPGDLLNKGRRKRVMHVPPGHACMTGLPRPRTSSAASQNSSNSSPQQSRAAPQGRCSTRPVVAVPLADVGLQSVSAPQQLEQVSNLASRQEQSSGPPLTGRAQGPARLLEVHHLFVRPQSAPNLAAMAGISQAAAGASSWQSQLQPVHVPEQPAAAATSAGGESYSATAPVLASAANTADMPPTTFCSSTDLVPGAAAPPTMPYARPGVELTRAVSQPASSAPASPDAGASPSGTQQGWLLTQEAVCSQQPDSNLRPGSLCPRQPALQHMSSTSSCLSSAQTVEQQQLSTPTLAEQDQAAATGAARMHLHLAGVQSMRPSRLRRFSTGYGAHAERALQLQLQQLRLAQAQHSESAADGLVLHDLSAEDTCDIAAAAATPVAMAAWAAVRPWRNRRLSNISVLSNFSTVSSTSIDESVEMSFCEEGCRTAGAGTCCSEPSSQTYSPVPGALSSSQRRGHQELAPVTEPEELPQSPVPMTTQHQGPCMHDHLGS